MSPDASPESRAPRPPSLTPPVCLPWQVRHTTRRHPLLTNMSDRVLLEVRIFSHDDLAAATQHWGLALPGDAIRVCLCERDLATTVATVCWFDGGQEYVWRFVP